MSQVRVSVANLAYFVHVFGAPASIQFGICNPKMLEKGITQFQALGGGAELTENGMRFLKTKFGAERFEKDEITGFYDARFLVDESHLEGVFNLFEEIGGKKSPYELDPIRDIIAEISGKEFSEIGTILTPNEVATIQVRYVKSMCQKPAEDGIGTSLRSIAGVPSRRLFRLYGLQMPSYELYIKMMRSPVVRALYPDELATTDGGSRKGKTRDGFVISDNLFEA